jgi:hypothetical protein
LATQLPPASPPPTTTDRHSNQQPRNMMNLNNLFDERRKTLVHIVQIILITLAIVLSIGRVTIKTPRATRANTVAVAMVSLQHSHTPYLYFHFQHTFANKNI